MQRKYIQKAIKLTEDLKKGRKSGKVHSIYKNVVDLQVENFIIALHEGHISMSPISIVLNKQVDVFVGDRVIFEEEYLSIGTERIEYNTTQLWDPYLMLKLTKTQIESALEELRTTLKLESSSSGYSDAAVTRSNERDDFLSQILRQNLWNFLDQLKIGSIQAEDSWDFFIKQTIGAGIGLTPSGDDFIVGLLLAFKTSDSKIAKDIFHMLTPIVNRYANRTNDISKAFLLAACKGEFGEKLHQLILAISTSKRSCKAEIDDVVSTGHSSGLDTLNGIVIGWELLGRKTE